MSSHLEYYGGPGSGGAMLPAGGTVMPSMENSMQGIPMQSGRPLSVCSVSSCGGGPSPPHRGNGLYSNCNGTNPQEEVISDDLLMSLSVRELNKRLHGSPREEVSQVSQFLSIYILYNILRRHISDFRNRGDWKNRDNIIYWSKRMYNRDLHVDSNSCYKYI